MKIQELARQTGLSAKTIRYYEEIGILPPPSRADNNYRQYSEKDIDCLRLVAGARKLELSLEEIKELLDMRDRREAPCNVLLERLEYKANEIAERIRALKQMEIELRDLYRLGKTFPTDDVEGKHCVCHLVSEQSG
ncbi:MAG: heavy metal-responsive transcriptional regulator [Anaerolineae bacterium]|nr:MAG: heavy metal-responsive transcriptional regulator [Anaerolineae bacterium]WKZ44741.1 MAG: MerR family transcriptional regulator [Anaerolineales bacterium]